MRKNKKEHRINTAPPELQGENCFYCVIADTLNNTLDIKCTSTGLAEKIGLRDGVDCDDWHFLYAMLHLYKELENTKNFGELLKPTSLSSLEEVSAFVKENPAREYIVLFEEGKSQYHCVRMVKGNSGELPFTIIDSQTGNGSLREVMRSFVQSTLFRLWEVKTKNYTGADDFKEERSALRTIVKHSDSMDQLQTLGDAIFDSAFRKELAEKLEPLDNNYVRKKGPHMPPRQPSSSRTGPTIV